MTTMYKQRIDWVQKKIVKKSITHNKKWCPKNGCGKRVEGYLKRDGGIVKIMYKCTICNEEFTKEEMLAWYGKPCNGKL